MLVMAGWVSVHAQWTKQNVRTNASFRGLAAINENVIWASGTGGTVIKTVDAGKTWNVMTVPGAEKLDLRDIEAFDAETAYVLSIGNGEDSRIYKTTDGGTTWKLIFKNTDEKAFYDAIACKDRSECVAVSDPVDGKYRFLSVVSKKDLNSVALMNTEVPAMAGEASFAASGTCLIYAGGSRLFLVTGGTTSRVLRSDDMGRTWRSADAPLKKGTAGSGAFSIAMRDKKNGVIVGGDYEKPNSVAETAAITQDGGRTWSSISGLSGYRSAAVFVNERTAVAVGTNGGDISRDGGRTWKPFGTENMNAVAADKSGTVWAVGPRGLVAKAFIGR